MQNELDLLAALPMLDKLGVNELPLKIRMINDKVCYHNKFSLPSHPFRRKKTNFFSVMCLKQLNKYCYSSPKSS